MSQDLPGTNIRQLQYIENTTYRYAVEFDLKPAHRKIRRTRKTSGESRYAREYDYTPFHLISGYVEQRAQTILNKGWLRSMGSSKDVNMRKPVHLDQVYWYNYD